MLLALLMLASPACAHDREALLSLEQSAFDQDMKGGWRKLESAGCEREAADLIRDWRSRHGSNDWLLFWHEGQLRAIIGDRKSAIALFRRSYKPAGKDYGGSWAPYVDGSIAFLSRDRQGLAAARARLASRPIPASFREERLANGSLVTWPPNLYVLDGFLRCWGKSYKDAYPCEQSGPPQ